MEKDMLWHKIYDAMNTEECPICSLLKNDLNMQMEIFLYENVNDRGIRAKIISSKGFCSNHAYILMNEFGDPLAHAILYSDLINNYIKELDKKSDFLNEISSNFNKKNKTNEKCIFCERTEINEKIYCDKFSKEYGGEFQEKYQQTAVLCREHLNMTTAKNAKQNKLIIEHTINKYQNVLDMLSEIIRKSDYRYFGESWTEEEKSAWKKAVGIISKKI